MKHHLEHSNAAKLKRTDFKSVPIVPDESCLTNEALDLTSGIEDIEDVEEVACALDLSKKSRNESCELTMSLNEDQQKTG